MESRAMDMPRARLVKPKASKPSTAAEHRIHSELRTCGTSSERDILWIPSSLTNQTRTKLGACMTGTSEGMRRHQLHCCLLTFARQAAETSYASTRCAMELLTIDSLTISLTAQSAASTLLQLTQTQGFCLEHESNHHQISPRLLRDFTLPLKARMATANRPWS